MLVVFLDSNFCLLRVLIYLLMLLLFVFNFCLGYSPGLNTVAVIAPIAAVAGILIIVLIVLLVVAYW